MSENKKPDHDPLEEAIRAFQGMPVCERPADAEVLARFGACQGDLSQRSRILIPSKWRRVMHLIASATAAAVLLFGALALLLRDSSPPESVQVAATALPGTGEENAIQHRTNTESMTEGLERLKSLDQCVTEAQVIVVATALDSTQAPPKRPGDLPENAIRFRVKRVLKGELAQKEITTRTPTAAAEFIGKEWVILLSPDYLAGRYQYASHFNVNLEPTVKSYLANRPGDVAVQPPPGSELLELADRGHDVLRVEIPPPGSEKSERLAVPPFEERVAESQVIVVATGLDSAPAPPSDVPGDPPEVLVRWQVKRVLKGEPGKKEFTTRTSPESAAAFIGTDYIVFLTPDFMAGKNQQFAASRHYVELERRVKQLIAREKE